MSRSRSPARSPEPHAAPPCPWDDLTPEGTGLDVHNFLTTLFSHTSNGLRRSITLPYAERFDLSVSEWRLLSVLAAAGTLPFPELVAESAADKAQVSRTLQLMAKRGLVDVVTPPAGRKGMVVAMTPAGQALYERIMPEAQRSQAAMILTLSPHERRTLYEVLRRLRAQCGEAAGKDEE
ncbi:MAG TPA: MarR family winged helix-turn-helix transcriptional regulator [Burkholderiaceae bacterium]|nr:MarR family winged helix-turn-helix transcriptional regulator [Burkholderiaceae bacterium]